MDVRLKGGLGGSLMSTLHHLMDLPVVVENALNAPPQTCVRDAGAMTATPADVKELPGSYVFVVDMPGVKPDEIDVELEDDRVLAVSGVRRRKDEEADQVQCLRMERRMGKFMRRFWLAENANADAITASCKDGVLTVTVEKLPPPRPRKPKMIEVKIA